MFRSNLKFALRNLIKNKQNSLINIIGLSLGITATLLILTYVTNEYSYESFQQNKENLYRVSIKWGNDKTANMMPGSQYPLGPALKNSVPDIIHSVRIRNNSDKKFEVSGKEFELKNAFFADADFNKVFTIETENNFDMEKFEEPFKILVSESFAEKYLPDEENTIVIENNSYQVLGKFKDVPLNTHFCPEILISFQTVKSVADKNYLTWNNWGSDFTYILTRPGADIPAIKKQADELLSKNTNASFLKNMTYDIHNIQDIHWRPDFFGDLGSKGNLAYIFIFSAAAVIILILACFNYINLSTAHALERMKEVGVKKVIGAHRGQLIFQFILESLLVAGVSALIGIVIFEMSYETLFRYIGVRLVLQGSLSNFMILAVTGLIIVSGLIAGFFPALYLSKFKPIDTIRSTKGTGASKQILRRVIVTTQFGVSIFLIFGTIVISQQIDFLKNADIGIDKENVAVIRFWETDRDYRSEYDLIRNELLKSPNITGVSAAFTLPGVQSKMTISTNPSTDPENKKNVRGMPVDFSFVSTMGLKLIEGRDFNKKIASDLNKKSILVNESFVKQFNLKDPLGKVFWGMGDKTIIGVVKDVHVESLQKKTDPMMFFINPEQFRVVTVKFAEDKYEAGVADLKSIWKKILPEAVLDFAFLDQMYQELYVDEEKTAGLLTIFSSLAIFISCIGLFGLTAFVSNKRSKEIGVRKALGASSSGITIMLTKEFIYWVILSGVVALPGGLLLMNGWLDNFAYKIQIGITPFLYSVVIVILLAVFTISSKSIKAARANPVDSLRDE